MIATAGRGRVLRAAARAVLLALGAALAACTRGELPCPDAKILRDADRVVVFQPGAAAAPQNVQYVGKIEQTQLACSYDQRTYERLDVLLGIQIAAEHPPTVQPAVADLKYFVAIVNLQGELLARKEFALKLPFKPGSAQASTIEKITQTIPLKYPQNGGSLQVWVGFQLSDAELQYNRAHSGS